MLRRLAPHLGYAYLTLVGWTTRWRVIGGAHREALRRANRRFIYAFWHQRQVFLTVSHRGDPAKVLVSRSKDGEIVARIMELSRIGAARGSSTRGAAAALMDMARTMSEGWDLGITPDGPKGPAREVKPGVVFLAKKLGVPILPIATAVSRKLVLRRSWDQFQVPLPFGRGLVRYGAPIPVGPEDDARAKAAEVKAALDRVTDEAEAGVFQEPGLLEGWLVRGLTLLETLAAPAIAGVYALKVLLSRRRRLLMTLPEELRERTGRPPETALSAINGRPVVWFHAASAGEVAAAEPLIAAVLARPSPPAVVVTSLTAAGRARAGKVPGAAAALLAPLDSLPTVRAFLASVRPYALVLVETELWPCMLDEAFRRGVSICLANGRLSPGSFGAYRRLQPLAGFMLRRISRLAVQTKTDADRFLALGAPAGRVRVCGNVKFDLMAAPAVLAAAAEAVRRLGWEGCPLLVAGSTHPVEEEAVLAAFQRAKASHPGLRLVLAPRHVERSDGAAAMLRRAGARFARWSELGASGPVPAGGPGACECLLLDAMGLLASWYGLASVCVVGGTFVPVGGHNLLEPALHAKPCVFGPHTFHTEHSARALEASGGGIRVADPKDLGRSLLALLDDPALGREAGAKALETLRSLQGAGERTMAWLGPCLELSPCPASAPGPEPGGQR